MCSQTIGSWSLSVYPRSHVKETREPIKKFVPWRRPLTGIPGSRQESDSIFTPEESHKKNTTSQEGEIVRARVCIITPSKLVFTKQLCCVWVPAGNSILCLTNISISQSIGLTFISDAEARCRAAVVRGEQQEQDVGCGNQEMRCLGAVVFTDEGGRDRGAVPDLQCVIINLSLEPTQTHKQQRKKKQVEKAIHIDSHSTCKLKITWPCKTNYLKNTFCLQHQQLCLKGTREPARSLRPSFGKYHTSAIDYPSWIENKELQTTKNSILI